MRWPITLGITALLAVFSGCRGDSSLAGKTAGGPLSSLPPEASSGFTDVTAAAGIDFVHSFGDSRFSNLVEAVGSGAVWFDYDRDGFVDLYIATGKHHPVISIGDAPAEAFLNRLFRNRGDGTFEDVTERAGVGCKGQYSMGVTAGDFDNDGYPDLYVSNYGPNALYRNRGDGTFEDVTLRAGVGDAGCSVAAVWLDYDRDGHLDLYVGNYIAFDPAYNLFYAPDGFPGPLAYAGEPDRLYRNRGDGTFEDVTASVGIGALGRAMSVTAFDFDDDGFDDVYVSNDAMENHLYHNEAGRSFREIALETGVAFNSAGDSAAHMAVDCGDFDGDGRLDIFVSDNSISSLFRNRGDGYFTDLSVPLGVGQASAQFVGWGSFFFDFDNDGDLDIFKVNADLSRLFGQEPQLFVNEKGERFRDISQLLGEYFQKEWMARGAAYADYDNDGDLDVLVVNLQSPAVLLRNDGQRGSWIEIDLRGGMRPSPSGDVKRSNREGLGARIWITAGGRTQVAQRRSAAGYLSQNDPRLHFGLAEAEEVERIEVRWPSGRSQVLTNLPARQIVVVEEPGD